MSKCFKVLPLLWNHQVLNLLVFLIQSWHTLHQESWGHIVQQYQCPEENKNMYSGVPFSIIQYTVNYITGNFTATCILRLSTLDVSYLLWYTSKEITRLSPFFIRLIFNLDWCGPKRFVSHMPLSCVISEDCFCCYLLLLTSLTSTSHPPLNLAYSLPPYYVE